MSNGTRVCIVLLALLLGVGCHQRDRLKLVTDATTRIDGPGFSVLPPQGGNWFQSGTETRGLLFFKGTEDGGGERDAAVYTVLAGVFPREIDDLAGVSDAEFLQIAGEKLGQYLVQQRQTQPERMEVAPYRLAGAVCIQYDSVQVERYTSRRQGRRIEFRDHGFFCRHPRSKKYLVQGFYGQRYYHGAPILLTKETRQESEKFLESVVFTDLP